MDSARAVGISKPEDLADQHSVYELQGARPASHSSALMPMIQMRLGNGTLAWHSQDYRTDR